MRGDKCGNLFPDEFLGRNSVTLPTRAINAMGKLSTIIQANVDMTLIDAICRSTCRVKSDTLLLLPALWCRPSVPFAIGQEHGRMYRVPIAEPSSGQFR